jgi:hypothetical protein
MTCAPINNTAQFGKGDKRGSDKMDRKLVCVKIKGQCSFSIAPVIYQFLIYYISFANLKILALQNCTSIAAIYNSANVWIPTINIKL